MTTLQRRFDCTPLNVDSSRSESRKNRTVGIVPLKRIVCRFYTSNAFPLLAMAVTHDGTVDFLASAGPTFRHLRIGLRTVCSLVHLLWAYCVRSVIYSVQEIREYVFYVPLYTRIHALFHALWYLVYNTYKGE